MALEVRNLSVSLSGVEILHSINLCVPSGSIHGLLGQNGAGKSTLMNAIMGKLPFSPGEVVLSGQALVGDQIRRSELIALQPQDGQLLARTTVAEITRLFSSFYSQPRDVATVLSRVQLLDKRNDRIETLSGGQKRSLLLALTLVANTPILLLDEPTSGIDVLTKRAIWDIIRELRAEGKAVLMSTHDMEEANSLSDKLSIIGGGSVLAHGTPEELARRVEGRTTVEFMTAEANLQNDEVMRLFSELSSIAPPDLQVVGQSLKVRIFTGDADHVVDRLTFNRAVKARNLRIRPPTLEDAFVFYADLKGP